MNLFPVFQEIPQDLKQLWLLHISRGDRSIGIRGAQTRCCPWSASRPASTHCRNSLRLMLPRRISEVHPVGGLDSLDPEVGKTMENHGKVGNTMKIYENYEHLTMKNHKLYD